MYYTILNGKKYSKKLYFMWYHTKQKDSIYGVVHNW
jgi:hypothetical protein